MAGKHAASRIRRRLLDAGDAATVVAECFFFAHKMGSRNTRARRFGRMVSRRNLFTCILYRLNMEAKPAGAVFGRAVGGNSHCAIDADLLMLSNSPFNKLLGTDSQPQNAAPRRWLRAGQRQR